MAEKKRLVSNDDDTFATPSVPLRKKSRLSYISSSSSEGSPGVINIPSSPFMRKLGYGTGVSVYLFERSPRRGVVQSPWAVKKVKARASGEMITNAEKRLRKEAELLKILKHENIVGYRALTKSADGTLCLSMENGEKALMDLIEVCQQENQGPFPAEKVHKVALSLARALSYLHNKHKLLHGDLKSANVLIKGDFETVKLCDFGVAVKMKEDLSGIKDEGPETDDYIGTEPWNAKEVLEGDVVTDKTDMYSYGLIIWEMLALAVPHSQHLIALSDLCNLDSEDEDADLDESAYYDALGTRPPLPDVDFDDAYVPLIEVFIACTNEEPSERPSAEIVVEVLSGCGTDTEEPEQTIS